MRTLRAWALSTVTVLLAATGVVVTPIAAHGDIACSVWFSPPWNSGGSFGTNITVTNLGDPVNPWTLRFTWPGTQQVTVGWNGTWTQSGPAVTVNAPSVAPALGTGQSVTIGFYGTYTGTNAPPTLFTLNDVPCTANTARSVRLTSPVNGQAFTVPTTIRLSAATTPANWAARIDFYSGTTLLGSATSAPYVLTWLGAPAGNYTLSARAIDVSGMSYASNVVNVGVIGPTAGPFVAVMPTWLGVAPGGTALFSVRLSRAPTSDTVVTAERINGDPDLDIQSGATLTFTPANWNISQTVRVAAGPGATVDDSAQFRVSAPNHQPSIFTVTVI
ncbi:hypothetical protein GCM10009555_031790 [Acrocarpospora macrocephala]|uniref:CBM2 domain-containing protein n=1 Tax=Acrocarpospora macrocephala TaxID=150177 RepID=A0A5M3WUY2_9ACTN|nr:cellulose binding domain-containing protein [Acrocarpospora macrocephala]GES12510.1 hypothetical protein Amac_061070 [Acrocarpospora macrocephala]